MAGAMSDISGYRHDGGALGGDGALTPQVSRILTSKLPLLNSPGSVIENSLYYDINSSSVSAVEMQETWGKDKITLTNYNYGSTPTCYIPSVLFANTTFLRFTLANAKWVNNPAILIDPGAQGSVGINFHFPHGWGFHAIQDIILYMGASSIAQIQISGYTNFMVAMACCETVTKRNSCIDAAGKFLSIWADLSPMDEPVADSIIYRLRGTIPGIPNSAYPDFLDRGQLQQTAAPYLREALVPVRLPFSSLCALEKRLSMDCKLSTQPIQITFSLRRSQFFHYITPGILDTDALYQRFDSIVLELWQQELSDKSLSVRNELLAMPEFNVGYPFQYLQSMVINIPDAGQQPDPFAFDQPEYLVNLSSIINADLTTFFFMLVWDGDGGDGSQFYPNYRGLYQRGNSPLLGLKMYDIQLILNGQRYFDFTGGSYVGATLAKQIDTPSYNILVSTLNPVDPASFIRQRPTTGFIANCLVYELNNSKLRAIVMESHMQNTGRFTNQTWQLRFKIDIGTQWGRWTGESIANPGDRRGRLGFKLHVCYSYNSVFLIGGDGGTTKLITN